MNIFYLDTDPRVAAQYHCDKHVVKMILESAQLLCTAHIVLDGDNDQLYKPCFRNHPCGVWTRASRANYLWLFDLFAALCAEYTHRYGRVHASERLLPLLAQAPVNISDGGLTFPALAMPEECRTDDAVRSYREYYRTVKAHILKWTGRAAPEWL